MSHEEPEEITIRYRLSDFDEESSIDDDFEGTCSPLVIKLDQNYFRLMEPLSVTPFGPWGPMLDFGEVIEANPLDDGTYRYVRRVQRARMWTRRLEPVSQQAIQQDGVRHILNQVGEAGGMWEWMAHCLTIQGLLAEGEVDTPTSIKELIDNLTRALFEAERMPINLMNSPDKISTTTLQLRPATKRNRQGTRGPTTSHPRGNG